MVILVVVVVVAFIVIRVWRPNWLSKESRTKAATRVKDTGRQAATRVKETGQQAATRVKETGRQAYEVRINWLTGRVAVERVP